MEQPPTTLPARQYEIDLLRFIAALAVVLFHYTYRAYARDNLSPIPYNGLSVFTRYGYLGVQLFFMISGYVVLLSAQGKTVRQFFVSRVQRLYPAFWVACTLTFLVQCMWGTGPKDVLSAPILYADLGQYGLNMTMLHTFLGIKDLDQAYWSLAIEICFYFVVSLLLAYKLMSHLNLIMGLWLGYSLVAASLSQDQGKLFSLLFFPQYAPYFIAGMLFFLLQKPAERTRVRYGLLVAAYGVAMGYGWASAVINSAHNSVAVVILSVFFLLLGLIASGKISFGRQPWLAKLGALTYPLYLLHGHIGYVLYHRIGHLLNKYVLLGGLLGLMLLAAYLITIWVEKPFGRMIGSQVDRILSLLDQPARKTPTQVVDSYKA